MSSAVSFPEHTCWNGEDFRYQRKPVMFRLRSEGDALGRTVDEELEADYGIWYHRDDEQIIDMLNRLVPCDWGRFVYHRQWDHSGIDIVDPEDDSLVAVLEVRQYRGPTIDEVDVTGSNVVRISDFRMQRELSQADVDNTELLLTEVLRDDNQPS